jgi:hypothetical protein
VSGGFLRISATSWEAAVTQGAARLQYADGGNAGPTGWTPYQQFNTAFASGSEIRSSDLLT